MMDWLRRNPLIGLLAAACALLAAVIAVEAGFGASLRKVLQPGSGKRASPADSKLLPPLAAVAVEQAYPETTARPLFTPTRRPAPELAVAPQSTFQKGQFTLQGVIMVGDNQVAMLREKANGRIHRIERGREVNGIKVVDIKPEGVTLAQGAEQEVLSLNVQRAGVGAPPLAAVQGPFPGMPVAPGAPQTQVLPSGQVAPGGPFPLPAGAQPAAVAPAPSPVIGAGTNPATRTAPDTAAPPMSPEELLARRRARRTQQNQ
jgi:general secretion pathway protein N